MRRTDAARFLSNTPADITSATARSAAIAANRMKSNSASFSPSALLGLPPSAFLVPNVEMLEAAYKENIPGELRDNPGSMVLLSNGYSCEQLQVCAQWQTHARPQPRHNLATPHGTLVGARRVS